jgi:lipopolysaccharide export LptBFGC system permease protein LptF
LAIPLGVAFGIAFGLRGRLTMNIAKMMLLCALAASALSFGNLAWAMPAANQAFKDMTVRVLRAREYQGAITGLKSYDEMTLSELRTESARFLAEGEPSRARQLNFSFHRRLSLAAAALALASVLLTAPMKHRRWRCVFGLAVCCIYWMLMLVGELASRRGYLPQPVGAWLPNLVLIASAILVVSSRSSRLRGSFSPAR